MAVFRAFFLPRVLALNLAILLTQLIISALFTRHVHRLCIRSTVRGEARLNFRRKTCATYGTENFEGCTKIAEIAGCRRLHCSRALGEAGAIHTIGVTADRVQKTRPVLMRGH